MIYREPPSSGGEQPNCGVMMKVAVEGISYDYESSDYPRHLIEELGGIPVNLFNDATAADSDWNNRDSRERYEQLTWLTDFTKSANELKDIALAYGNDVTTGFMYCDPFLIVRIGPAVDRII